MTLLVLLYSNIEHLWYLGNMESHGMPKARSFTALIKRESGLESDLGLNLSTATLQLYDL